VSTINNTAEIFQTLTTVIGEEYVMYVNIMADASNVTAGSAKVRVDNINSAAYAMYPVASNGVLLDNTYEFTADTINTRVAIQVASLTQWGQIGDTAYGYNIGIFKKSDVKAIQNYTATVRDTYQNQNVGMLNHLLTLNAIGMITGKADAGTIECHDVVGEKVTIPTRTRTADITIELTPNVVESKLLIDTTTGDITMNANGTVTASSGSVAIDTTTVQVGVKSIITVTGISISGESTLFSGFNGTIHQFTEETS
jgi:hypothetical protein